MMGYEIKFLEKGGRITRFSYTDDDFSGICNVIGNSIGPDKIYDAQFVRLKTADGQRISDALLNTADFEILFTKRLTQKKKQEPGEYSIRELKFLTLSDHETKFTCCYEDGHGPRTYFWVRNRLDEESIVDENHGPIPRELARHIVVALNKKLKM